jgi:ATP-dependent RNA helicase DeaD
LSLNIACSSSIFLNLRQYKKKAIPEALSGRDIIGSAQTGSGKTMAFLLPMMTHLLKANNQKSKAMVITPTRELAQQIMTQVQALLKEGLFLQTALLIGGDSMFKQLKQLDRDPRIIIGTPGRLNDHLRRNSLNLQCCDFVILDETDRMLDMGFSVQIETVLAKVSSTRQTLMFSATFPDSIQKISKRYLENPVNVAVDKTSAPATHIKQETVMIAESDKYARLLEELEKSEGSVVLFMKTKHSTERMARKLTTEGYKSDAIHGDLRQSRRSKVIESFRKNKFRVLVATDVAARGLDIPHIEHVINFDLPQCPEDYIHRIGRTGRNGASGDALNLVSPADKRLWHAISILLNPNAKSAGGGMSQSRGRSRFGDRNSGQKSFKKPSRDRGNSRAEGFSRGPRNGRSAGNVPKRQHKRDNAEGNVGNRIESGSSGGHFYRGKKQGQTQNQLASQKSFSRQFHRSDNRAVDEDDIFRPQEFKKKNFKRDLGQQKSGQAWSSDRKPARKSHSDRSRSHGNFVSKPIYIKPVKKSAQPVE